MVSETIAYADIFRRAQTIDRSAPIAVLLNRYQAWLFRTKFEMLARAGIKVRPLRGFYDSIRLVCVMVLILVTAPKLAFLSDFYEMDGSIIHRVKFEPSDAGVIVYFLPKPA